MPGRSYQIAEMQNRFIPLGRVAAVPKVKAGQTPTWGTFNLLLPRLAGSLKSGR
jgi:hypothetical protein